jgi:porphobilinogen synthase
MSQENTNYSSTQTSGHESLHQRPRRNRKTKAMRDLVREHHLDATNLIWPLFITEGRDVKQSIASMPGCYRWSIDLLVRECQEAYRLGIPAVALFPALDDSKKDKFATESKNADGLLQRTIREIKNKCPDLLVISDVAMDPYSSDGHDGLVENGKILNDETLPILAAMAVSQAEAGSDIVAPSDMMDGRVKVIRQALDQRGFQDTSILAYSAKYASAFYGPFRDALESAPKSGDKKTYQMDPANANEALREIELDIQEGADIVMVKPALAYLDIIAKARAAFKVPIAAYHVSGEYAMIKAAAEKGWLNEKDAMLEALTSIKRAGADMILTYYAKEAAKHFQA